MGSMSKLFGSACILSVGLCAPAFAGANLLTNGDFSQETINGAASTTSEQLVAASQGINSGAVLTGWVNNGYSFVFTPGAGASGTTADTTGAYSTQFNSQLQLWGPGDGSANGLTNSPNGGNFVAIDGAYEQGPLTQSVTGLTVGTDYVLSFYWAAAQQDPFSNGGATTESFAVTFGNTTQTTQTITAPDKGFAPWRLQTFTFQATGTTQLLSFLASGTPNGVPPFALLDGVSLQVPEPATWAGLGFGVALLGALRLVRFRRSGPQAA